MRTKYLRLAVVLAVVSLGVAAGASNALAQTQGPVRVTLDQAVQMALEHNHNLKAARTAIQQSEPLKVTANGKADVTGTFVHDHVSDASTGSFFGSFQIPIFNRNQGEIARTGFVITQAQELATGASEQVMSDVSDAYEGVPANDQVVTLYGSGYLDEARLSRDISEYAYKRGAASLFDFLDAERSYRATELAYRQSLASYLLAVEQLREAVGPRSLP